MYPTGVLDFGAMGAWVLIFGTALRNRVFFYKLRLVGISACMACGWSAQFFVRLVISFGLFELFAVSFGSAIS